MDKDGYLYDTILNYSSRVDSFANWAYGSESVNAESIRSRFLKNARNIISKDLSILDIGCGPGRDILEFNKEKDCRAIGLEPVIGFYDIIKRNNLEVIVGDIINPPLDLFKLYFNSLFCLASLFHIPLKELPIVIKNLRGLLISPGVLLTSFIAGENTNEYKMKDGRWCTILSSKDHEDLLVKEGFTIIDKFRAFIYNGEWEIYISKI